MPEKKDVGLELYKDARKIFKAGVKSALPYSAVKSIMKKNSGHLTISGKSYPIRGKSVYAVGAGKASALMAKAAEEIIGSSLSAGLVIVKYGHLVPVKRIELAEGAHPLPDSRGAAATKRLVKMIEKADKGDIVIGLFSGGGSALLAAPYPGISLKEKITTTDLLMRAGADISELNAVRKHISQVKGGQLARIAFPATMINLLLSDVIGDRLDVIASGPAVPDSSDFKTAWKVIEKYRLAEKIPSFVRKRLEDGAEGKLEDNPKKGDPLFKNVRNIVIGSNSIALKTAIKTARSMGYCVDEVKRPMMGEASEYASRFLAKALRKAKRKPYCLIAGGETTVTVKGKGKGGRSQEFALSVLRKLSGKDGVLVFSAGTDGTDGPTDAAGAAAWSGLLEGALKKGLVPEAYLDNNDSYNFFDRAGGLYKSGPTGTNVMDLAMVLIR